MIASFPILGITHEYGRSKAAAVVQNAIEQLRHSPQLFDGRGHRVEAPGTVRVPVESMALLFGAGVSDASITRGPGGVGVVTVEMKDGDVLIIDGVVRVKALVCSALPTRQALEAALARLTR